MYFRNWCSQFFFLRCDKLCRMIVVWHDTCLPFKIYIKVSLHCFLTFRNKNIKDISMPSFFCLFPFFFCRIFCSSTYVGNPIEVLSCKILFFLEPKLLCSLETNRIPVVHTIPFELDNFLECPSIFCHHWPLSVRTSYSIPWWDI